MIKALFISDLHGSIQKYEFLFKKILTLKPAAVFIGGDLLGFAAAGKDTAGVQNFLSDYLAVELQKLRLQMNRKYPAIFAIMGNDDPKTHESELVKMTEDGILIYANERKIPFHNFTVCGYSYIPPSPYMNKDWEKYDVSMYVDVGSISPEAGFRFQPVSSDEIRYNTIKRDLQRLFDEPDLSDAICLFHSPPYQTSLDRAELDGIKIDHVPLDVHVGSIAIKEFIRNRSPYLTLHGHIHESTRLTGKWQEKIGKTICFQAAVERNEKGIILFDLLQPEKAEMLKE